eukprot:1400115-Amphidinium_carterae.1
MHQHELSLDATEKKNGKEKRHNRHTEGQKYLLKKVQTVKAARTVKDGTLDELRVSLIMQPPYSGFRREAEMQSGTQAPRQS